MALNVSCHLLLRLQFPVLSGWNEEQLIRIFKYRYYFIRSGQSFYITRLQQTESQWCRDKVEFYNCSRQATTFDLQNIIPKYYSYIIPIHVIAWRSFNEIHDLKEA